MIILYILGLLFGPLATVYAVYRVTQTPIPDSMLEMIGVCLALPAGVAVFLCSAVALK